MQRMSELVEYGLHLVHVEILFQITYVHDDRTYHIALSIDFLVADIVHPSTTSLALARQVVSSEDTQQLTLVVCHFIGCHLIFIISRHTIQFLHVHSIERLGSNKDSVYHILQLEVRLDEVFVEVIFQFAHLLGIVPPIPRFNLATCWQFACCDVLVHHFLHVVHLFLCFTNSSYHDAVEEGINCCRVVSHLWFEDKFCRILVAHDLSLFDTQSHHVEDKLTVVKLITVMSTHGVSFEHLFPQFAVLRGGHRIGIVRYTDAELLLEGVAFAQDVITNLLRLGSHLRIDFTQTSLLILRQTDTATLEALEVFLQHHLLFTGQVALVAIVDGSHTLIQLLVECDVVTMFRHQRNSGFHH